MKKGHGGLYLVFAALISDKYHISSDKIAFFLFRKVPRKYGVDFDRKRTKEEYFCGIEVRE
jgi:hypothetical protein